MSDKEQRIRVRAYHIWEREGRGEGRAEDHWREAQSEVERELAQLAAEAKEQPKKKALTRGKSPDAKARADTPATMGRAGAAESEQVDSKPAASRGKTTSSGTKPSRAAKPSSAEKPAAPRSRRTSPT